MAWARRLGRLRLVIGRDEAALTSGVGLIVGSADAIVESLLFR